MNEINYLKIVDKHQLALNLLHTIRLIFSKSFHENFNFLMEIKKKLLE